MRRKKRKPDALGFETLRLDCEPNAGGWIVRLLVPLASGRADGAIC